MVLIPENSRRAFFLLVILLCAAIPANAETLKLNGKTMGSYYAIVIDGAAESDAADIQEQIETVLADVNRQMSTWDSESEISKFNRSENTDWFPVSPGFAEVVHESIRLHKLTNGAFDPTVAPLIDLWGFGARRPKSFPTQEAIDQALTNTGMQFIQATLKPPSIRRTQAGIMLSLSAIAPGHGSDRVSLMLSSLGFPSHSVDIGGEVRTGIAKADGGKWRLGIESPLGGIQRVIECAERSIATSGDYRNYFEYKGVRYSHAIDPTTGRPVVKPPASISVLSDSCMTADGLATGLMVMGTEKGFQFAKQHGLSVLFLDVVDDKTIVEHASGEFLATGSSSSTSNSKVLVVRHTIPYAATLAVFLLALTAMAIVLFRRRWSETSSV